MDSWQEAFLQCCTALQSDARAKRIRHLIVVQGESLWCHDAAALIPGIENALWLSAEQDSTRNTLAPDKARTMLGLEVDTLVCDLFSIGFDPLALAAVSGAVRAGGLVIVLAPPLIEWGGWEDVVSQRIAEFSGQQQGCEGSRYLRRAALILGASSEITLVRQDAEVRPASLTDGDTEEPVSTEILDEQQHVVERMIERISLGPTVLLLTAARGRGKSAALGRAVAGLMKRDCRQIWVTAPRLRNSGVIFDHALDCLPLAERSRDRVVTSEGEIRFIAPDALLQRNECPDVLIVDEAAAIPLPMLQSMLQRFPRIVFASTQDGYEGSGKGFATRFHQQLDRLRPGWQALSMRQPLRWERRDPVESVLGNILLLEDARSGKVSHQSLPETSSALQIECINREQLLENEVLLREIYGLLVQAHYQTTPMDLRYLLDAENLELWIARQDRRTVATAMLAVEGGLAPELSREVFYGRRRPRGHLLPQLLASRGPLPEAATLRCLRVVRIAVRSEYRRQGIGHALLQRFADAARARGLDYLGASFGLNLEVLDFWCGAGYRTLHFGMRANAASGQASVAVGLGLTKAGQNLVDQNCRYFAEVFHQQLGETCSKLESEAVVMLLSDLLRGREIERLSPADYALTKAVAHGSRGYESSGPAILRLLLVSLQQGCFQALQRSDQQLLIRRVLQAWSWNAVAMESEARGHKEIVARFRHALGRLLAACPDSD